jgi:PPK2 family polyphosphate:nucleotide phosphotransferase
MSFKKIRQFIDGLEVSSGKGFKLSKYQTDYDHKMMTKEEGTLLLKEGVRQLAEMQDKLYAHDRFSVLIVIQAMDAAGKDGVIKHVMSGLNPQGVKVNSFKVPTSTELDHDYFWRHYIELPARGEIGIFNRSHYENVLVTRVYPQYIMNERLPGIERVEDIKPSFWENRFKQINRFERNLHENGTVIMKFMLHVSKDEQKKRFLERIEDPSKNWKFSMGDLKARADWDRFMSAYDETIRETAQPHAPWYIIPADDKWFARLSVAAIIHRHFERLKLTYPKPDKTLLEDLGKAKEMLLSEKPAQGKPSKGKAPAVKKVKTGGGKKAPTSK